MAADSLRRRPLVEGARGAKRAASGLSVWVARMEVRDLRNVKEASLEFAPGLNVLVGRNAQGKTSLLEAVGLLARGRSFRTEDTETLIRPGAGARDLDTWNERFVELGARLRDRRASYVERLRVALRHGFHPEGERYDVVLVPAPLAGGVEAERPRLQAEMEGRRRDEGRTRRSLVGPQRDGW